MAPEVGGMTPSAITFIINGKTYSLRPDDIDAVRQLPGAERRQLIALLEVLKQQESLSHSATQGRPVGPKSTLGKMPASNAGADPLDPGLVSSGRLGSGDVDNLMARLVLEEKRNRKPGLTRAGVYKVFAGLAVVFILLVLIL